MKFYLAAAYDRKEEMRGYRKVLRSFGHEVTSRWIDGHPEINNGDIISVDMLNDPEYLRTSQEVAMHDLEDIQSADAVISFHGQTNQGGRHVEYGYALALDKPIYIVGDLENLFHVYHFQKFASFQDLIESLRWDEWIDSIVRSIRNTRVYHLDPGDEERAREAIANRIDAMYKGRLAREMLVNYSEAR